MNNYLGILEESLIKKIQVMDEIQKYNEAQYRIFTETTPDMEKFDGYISEKGRLIDQLNQLDEGFETLYAKVAEELSANRAQYATQIRRMQEQVKTITEKSVSIQAQEARNKALIEAYFAGQRTALRNNRQNSKAVYDYYKNMSKPAYMESQLWDSRQ